MQTIQIEDSFISTLLKTKNSIISKELLGVYINPDEIEKRKGD